MESNGAAVGVERRRDRLERGELVWWSRGAAVTVEAGGADGGNERVI